MLDRQCAANVKDKRMFAFSIPKVRNVGSILPFIAEPLVQYLAPPVEISHDLWDGVCMYIFCTPRSCDFNVGWEPIKNPPAHLQNNLQYK